MFSMAFFKGYIEWIIAVPFPFTFTTISFINIIHKSGACLLCFSQEISIDHKKISFKQSCTLYMSDLFRTSQTTTKPPPQIHTLTPLTPFPLPSSSSPPSSPLQALY